MTFYSTIGFNDLDNLYYITYIIDCVYLRNVLSYMQMYRVPIIM